MPSFGNRMAGRIYEAEGNYGARGAGPPSVPGLPSAPGAPDPALWLLTPDWLPDAAPLPAAFFSLGLLLGTTFPPAEGPDVTPDPVFCAKAAGAAANAVAAARQRR